MRLAVPLVVVFLLIAGSVSAVATGLSPTPPDRLQGSRSIPDPDEDVLGWEDGYWYNGSIDVDRSDGLDRAELDAILARTMARVERVRHLEFTEEVPVAVVSREEFERQERNGTVSPSLRRFDNAKFEALFFVNESTDSIAVQRENAGGSVLGYYDPGGDRIVLVVESGSDVRVDERTLAHELVHALQDQHFGLERFDAATRDGRNAQDAVIEGDAGFVEFLYRQRCSVTWTCVTGPNAETEVVNFGVYLLLYFPYSDGPAFVREFYRQGGWKAVNALYVNPPVTTEQVIHPERYGTDVPNPVAEVVIGPTEREARTAKTSTVDTPDLTDTVGEGPNTAIPNVTSTETSTSNATATSPTPPNGTTGTAVPNATPETTSPGTTTESAPTSSPSGTEGTSSPTPTRSATGTNTTTAELPRNVTRVRTVPVDTPVSSTVVTPSRPPTPGATDARETRTPAGEWRRVRPPDRPDYATLGEAGIAAMFVYPTYRSEGETTVVPGKSFFNFEGDDLSAFDPYDYDQPYSEGWDGDRLQVYRNEDNETAYVWRIAWDSAEDAREFARGYRRLLAYWDGRRLAPGVYRIPDGGFADAFHVAVEGKRVTIVNAPRVEALSVFSDVSDALERTPVALTVGGGAEFGDRSSPISTNQPGFGPMATIVALLLATATLAARRVGTETSR